MPLQVHRKSLSPWNSTLAKLSTKPEGITKMILDHPRMERLYLWCPFLGKSLENGHQNWRATMGPEVKKPKPGPQDHKPQDAWEGVRMRPVTSPALLLLSTPEKLVLGEWSSSSFLAYVQCHNLWTTSNIAVSWEQVNIVVAGDGRSATGRGMVEKRGVRRKKGKRKDMQGVRLHSPRMS